MPYDVETISALASGAIVVRDLVTVAGKTMGGSVANFALSRRLYGRIAGHFQPSPTLIKGRQF